MEQRDLIVVGWRERVDLPDWGVAGLVAKVDTGARTSAIHVDDVEPIGDDHIGFWVVLSRKQINKRVHVEAPIVRMTNVRSSSGHRQPRYIVKTALRMAGIEREVELSLVPRPHMLCRMLIGRSALTGLYLVDASLKHATQEPSR